MQSFHLSLPLRLNLRFWKEAATFSSYTKGSDFQNGVIDVKKDALIRLPLFDFPGMVTKIDGKVVSHVNNNCSGEVFCLGLITYKVPVGNTLSV
jgi:hypothetical protein